MKSTVPVLLLVLILGCHAPNKKTDEKAFTKALACTFSEIAYSNYPDSLLKQYLPGWKVVWKPAPVNGVYAFAAGNGNKIVIAVRGSVLQFTKDAFDNWVRQDLNVVTQKSWKYADSSSIAKISEGSYDAFEHMLQLKDQSTGKTLWQFIQGTANNSTSILITGHSLGGNLSTVYASWFTEELKKQNKEVKKTDIITFAAPAAGNTAFANDFNTKFPDALLIENTNDIAPKFPIANAVGNLSILYKPSPAAKEIEISFSILSLKLSTIFDGLKLTLKGMEAYNNNSVYTQPSAEFITINLSGKYKENAVENFFLEAKYQHGVEQYAAAVGAPIIKVD